MLSKTNRSRGMVYLQNKNNLMNRPPRISPSDIITTTAATSYGVVNIDITSSVRLGHGRAVMPLLV